MTIAITGASGFIGRRLMKALASGDHKLRVLSRHAGTNLPLGVQLYVWDAMKGQPPEESLDGVDAVVHLAGEPIAQRWNDDVKLKIRESRATGTRNLVQALSTASRRPAVLVCGSAIGYYGSPRGKSLTQTPPRAGPPRCWSADRPSVTTARAVKKFSPNPPRPAPASWRRSAWLGRRKPIWRNRSAFVW